MRTQPGEHQSHYRRNAIVVRRASCMSGVSSPNSGFDGIASSGSKQWIGVSDSLVWVSATVQGVVHDLCSL
jgi:hypothetical protein